MSDPQSSPNVRGLLRGSGSGLVIGGVQEHGKDQAIDSIEAWTP